MQLADTYILRRKKLCMIISIIQFGPNLPPNCWLKSKRSTTTCLPNLSPIWDNTPKSRIADPQLFEKLERRVIWMGDVLKNRDEYLQIQWVAAIQECKTNGLTNKEYCIQHGLSEKSFYYWQKNLRAQIGGVVPKSVFSAGSSVQSGELRSWYRGAELMFPEQVDTNTASVLPTLHLVAMFDLGKVSPLPLSLHQSFIDRLLLLQALTSSAYSASIFCLLSACSFLTMKIPPYLG